MRFLPCLAFALAALCVGDAAPARAQQAPEREITVINRARQAINEIYASPAAANAWGEDRLGEQMLAPGHSQHVKLGRARDCQFDVQAVYVDASREMAHGVDVCRNHSLTFDGSAATDAPAAPLHSVTLTNRAPRPIQQVLISPSDAGDWGDDRLGDTSISVGDSGIATYRGDCIADLRVVFDNRSAEERRSIDLCVGRPIAIRPGWTTADTVPTELQAGVELVTLNVANHAGHPVIGIYVFPAGKTEYGPNLLGGATLDAGGKIAVAVQHQTGVCGFAAHVVFGGKLPVQIVGGLDICRSRDLELGPPG